ncbi:MAG TPA: shikimate kinase [Bacteroidia bacterium]
MNIFLLGYMGCGKSKVGKLLAEKLQFEFIDLDASVESEASMPVAGIFEKYGEEKFRLMEHEHLKKLSAKDNAIISTGGGAPCFHHNMELINQNGISVYLDATVDLLVKRLLKARVKRPLIAGMNEAELKTFIETALKKRLPFYMQARHRVRTEEQTPDEMAEKIAAVIFAGK